MPQARKYQTNAQRQAAYRQRTVKSRSEQLSARSLPPLPAIQSMPGEARWKAALSQAHWLMETTATEMENYSDDRSDDWHDSDRGCAFADRLEALQEAVDSLEQLIA